MQTKALKVYGSFTKLKKVRFRQRERIAQNVGMVYSWQSILIGLLAEDVVTPNLRLKFSYCFFNPRIYHFGNVGCDYWLKD